MNKDENKSTKAKCVNQRNSEICDVMSYFALLENCSFKRFTMTQQNARDIMFEANKIPQPFVEAPGPGTELLGDPSCGSLINL